jgi:sec-independent protein translocase protein TatB
MFDISFAELLLIVVVAVVFIGPKELPHVIRAVAKALRAIKSVTNEIKKTFDDLAEESGIKPEIKMIQGDDGNWYESYDVSHLHKAPPEDKQP